MARQQEIRSRVPAELLADASTAPGVPDDISAPELIRYALAVVAGKPDPVTFAKLIDPHPSRWRPMPYTPAMVIARDAYRASLADDKPIPCIQLVPRFGVTVHQARRIVAQCKAEHQAAA